MDSTADSQSPSFDPSTQVHLSDNHLSMPYLNGFGEASQIDFNGEASTSALSQEGQMPYATMGGPSVLDVLAPMNGLNLGANGAYSMNGMPFIVSSATPDLTSRKLTSQPPPPGPYMSPSMNPNIMTGNYGPAAAAAAAAAALNQQGRTVYVGNLPEG